MNAPSFSGDALYSNAAKSNFSGAGINQMPAAEFRLAFVLVALVSLLGLIDTWRLQAGSGDHLSKKASA